MGMYLAVGAAFVVAIAVLEVFRQRLRAEQGRLRSLIDLSRHFYADLDPEVGLHEVARAVVPALCDICLVDVLEQNGFRRAAAKTSNPNLNRAVDVLSQHPPSIDNRSHPAVVATSTQEPVILTDITPEILDAAANTARHRRAAAFARGGTAVIVPILADREALGAISLVRLGRSAQPFGPEDVSVAVDLAARAGEALTRARTHKEVRDAFVSIQRALLPERLPTVAGVSVGALYRPAHAATLVGGDWYAMVPIDHSRLAIAIGDAAGSGLLASAQMARVRYALLALAREGHEPGSLLEALNTYLFAIGQDNFVTATYGVLDSERGLWAEARAGHLPTIVRRPSGEARFIESTVEPGGVPLGVVRDATYHTHEHKLTDETTMLLYTDGVIERRGEHLDRGLERLRRAFETLTITDPADACAHIADEVAGHIPEDDVAILMTTLETAHPAKSS